MKLFTLLFSHLNFLSLIRYYKQAYLSLLDIRCYDTNILEVKLIAGFVNYKVNFSFCIPPLYKRLFFQICQLYFDNRHPIEAIGQFRKHIDIFRNKAGPPELSFEHSAWMSKQ
jgi:hypothetical protein